MNTTPLANSSNSALHQASSAIEQASELTHRGVEAVRDGLREGVHQVREKAQTISEQTACYIQEKPVKSVLIAAATGATLMGLLSLIVRGSGRG